MKYFAHQVVFLKLRPLAYQKSSLIGFYVTFHKQSLTVKQFSKNKDTAIFMMGYADHDDDLLPEILMYDNETRK